MRLVFLGALVGTALVHSACSRRIPREPNHDPQGLYLGTLAFPGVEIRAGLRLQRDVYGRIHGFWLRPDQSHEDLTIFLTQRKHRSIAFQIPAIHARFKGRFSEDFQEIAGRLETRAGVKEIVLRRVREIPEPSRPQTPKPPFPYEVEDVRVRNEEDGIELAGTLTLPRDAKTCPACVLLSGVGSHDRDYTIQGHKPFLVLADALTREGIAVLRLDDRGVGESRGSLEGVTLRDLSRDALAAVAFLRDREGGDRERIGLIGHSEGGIVASLAAARSEDVAFLVLLASPGLSGVDYNLQFEASMGRAMGLDEKALAEKAAFQKEVFFIVAGRGTDEEKAARLREHFATLEPPPPPGRVDASVRRLLSPWMRFSLRFDPVTTLWESSSPFLAVFGGKDLHVPPEGNAEALKRVAESRGDGLSAVEILPGHNHFFQRCGMGLPAEYGRIEETLSPALLALVSKWIGEAVRTR